MDGKEFSKIRKLLGKTQDELSKLLCVSAKAVQSYEQGWRKVQPHHEQQILLLLSLKIFSNKKIMDVNPCWEVKDCPDEWRDKCIVWELKARHFCWFLNGTFCQGKVQENWDDKIKMCRECKVYNNMFLYI